MRHIAKWLVVLAALVTIQCEGKLKWRYDSVAQHFVRDGRIVGPPEA